VERMSAVSSPRSDVSNCRITAALCRIINPGNQLFPGLENVTE